MSVIDIIPGHSRLIVHGIPSIEVDGWSVVYTLTTDPDHERQHFTPTRDQAERWAKWLTLRQGQIERGERP